MSKLNGDDLPFMHLYFDDIWARLASSFAWNSDVNDAADEWLEKQLVDGPEIIQAVINDAC